MRAKDAYELVVPATKHLTATIDTREAFDLRTTGVFIVDSEALFWVPLDLGQRSDEICVLKDLTSKLFWKA
jgi:hypothetical protein